MSVARRCRRSVAKTLRFLDDEDNTPLDNDDAALFGDDDAALPDADDSTPLEEDAGALLNGEDECPFVDDNEYQPLITYDDFCIDSEDELDSVQFGYRQPRKATDAQQSTARFWQEVVQLESKADDPQDRYAKDIKRVSRAFAYEDQQREAVKNDPAMANPLLQSLPFEAGTGLHALTFEEWLSIERRQDNDDASWFFDNILGNMVMSKVTDANARKLFGDPWCSSHGSRASRRIQ